MEEGQQQIV